MNIQEYPIVERAVYDGVGTGVSKLLENVESFKNPDTVVETISYSVMQELCGVIDFGQQALKFSPALMQRMWTMAREEAEKQQTSEVADQPKG